MPSPLSDTFARLVGRPFADDAPDRDLLARFHEGRDEAAFAALVRRHGPMVQGVCRRALRDPHAADDAFQATFLVLAKKAGAVAWQESLGGWLYRVARNVCRKAVGRAPRPAAPLTPDAHPARPDAPPSDLSAVLDEELVRLPAVYRDPIVLCHLEGRTVDDAARALGISDGQLRGRLHRGREKLRERLTARGVTLGATALAVALTAAAAQAVPVSAAAALASAAVGTSAGVWPATVSESVRSLTLLGLSAMSRSTLSTVLAIAAALVVTVAGVGVGVRASQSDPPAVPPVARRADPPPVLPVAAPQARADDDDKKKGEAKIDRREGVIKSVDGPAGKLVLTTDEDKFDLTVELDAKADVTVARRPVKLADLPAGMRATASFRGDAKAAFKLEAEWPELHTTVKGADAAKNTLNIKTEGNNGFEFDVALPVAADARIRLDGIPVGLADVPVGGKVHVEFGLDKKTVFGLQAEAAPGDLSAVVKVADAASTAVTLTVMVAGHKHERRVDLAFAVAADAKFRLAGKDVALADLKADMPVLVRLAADRRTVTAVWADQPRPKADTDDD